MNFPLIIFILFLVSCQNKQITILKPKNDTVEVLNLALATAFYHENLPGIDELKRNYQFEHSILFTSDSLPLSILPKKADTFYFKIINYKEMCLCIFI